MRAVNIPAPSGAYNRGIVQWKDWIVIHAIGEFIDFDDGPDYYCVEFLNKVRKLSAQYFLSPSGVVIRNVPYKEVAWHAAGDPEITGLPNFNSGSIGIEVMVPGYYNYGTFLEKIKTPWVTDIQYKQLGQLVAELIGLNPRMKGVVSHSSIDPTRKFDPGDGFDWAKLRYEVVSRYHSVSKIETGEKKPKLPEIWGDFNQI